MSKPYGMSVHYDGVGIGLRVNAPTHVEDKIWEAVEAAISAGWTPTQFRREAASAWEHELKEQAKAAVKELS